MHHGQEKFIQIARRSLQTTTRWGSWYCATFTMLVVRGCVSKLEVLEFTGFHVLFWVFINHFLWIVCKCACHFTQHERGALSLEWSNKNRRPNQTKLKRSFYHLTTPTATVQFWSETFPGYNFGTSSFAAGWNKRNMISNNRSTNIAIYIYIKYLKQEHGGGLGISIMISRFPIFWVCFFLQIPSCHQCRP